MSNLEPQGLTAPRSIQSNAHEGEIKETKEYPGPPSGRLRGYPDAPTRQHYP